MTGCGISEAEHRMVYSSNRSLVLRATDKVFVSNFTIWGTSLFGFGVNRFLGWFIMDPVK